MKQITINTFFLFFSSVFLFTIIACNSTEKENIRVVKTNNYKEIIIDDFKIQNPAWKTYKGDWVFRSGELEQKSTKDDFPVILFEGKEFSDLDVSVNFKPISGDIDASGGVIFRAEDEDNYYIVRANALENNYRLYTFVDGLRHELTSATVAPPSLNIFHQMRVVAEGDHIQAYLDGKLEIDYHDKTFEKGYTGLWTKADSVTLFDDFKVKVLTP